VAVAGAESTRVALFGSSTGTSFASEAAHAIVEQHAPMLLTGPGGEQQLGRAAHALDSRLADEYARGDGRAAGALAVAEVLGDQALVVMSSTCGIYVVHAGELVYVGEVDPERPVSGEVGGPSREARARLALVRGVRIDRGDRLVLSTQPLSGALSREEIGTLATRGTTETAARALAETAEYRTGLLEVAVAVLPAPEPPADEEASATPVSGGPGLDVVIGTAENELPNPPETEPMLGRHELALIAVTVLLLLGVAINLLI
jgi:hypothetical protein